MPPRKERTEIPADVAAQTLFESDRTCCVCNDRNKSVQLHHIDENPANSVGENLAVLCLECHRDTQIRGGFDRKLDRLQVQLYRQNWLETVRLRRLEQRRIGQPEPVGEGFSLRYLQMEEISDEQLYSFKADYALLEFVDRSASTEINSLIEAFVIRQLQRFRANAIANKPNKEWEKTKGLATAWDDLSLSHSISLFSTALLSLEFQQYFYFSGAMHPNSGTETLNFRFQPALQLEIQDIFKPLSPYDPSPNYLDIPSEYCVSDLHSDEWILRGAGPDRRNFECFSLGRHAMKIHFDPYQVGSYAEGKYEVVVPYYLLRSIMRENITALLEPVS